MISIEKVSNGFIVRIEEAGEDETQVFQKEFNSMNMALAAICKMLLERWQHDEEAIQVKLDVSP